PDGIDVRPQAEIELGGVDLVCLAVPSGAYPEVVDSIRGRTGDRAGMLLLAKGLIAPNGEIPSDYVRDRVKVRGIACLGGPAHAREAASGSAALVLGTRDGDFRMQLGDVFDRAGLICERSNDMVGIEMAGVAKNVAVLAAATAESYGLNSAGIAAAEVWKECVGFAELKGARLETFNGLAGVGDLLATVMAPGSRNRRAGELLGTGSSVTEIRSAIGQASEALESIGTIARTLDAAGCPNQAIAGLAAVTDGTLGADEWVAAVRRIGPARQLKT
ncbi:MAG: NAD(P)H-dependent glycerol-3-phosphate dehydrogenase, partial [Solirubrobacterales bacterium]